MSWKCSKYLVAASMGFLALVAQPVAAEYSASTNYRFDEMTVGAGGLVQSASTNYQANSVLGDIAIGETSSANYQLGTGSLTTNEPTLSVVVNAATIDLGQLTSSTPATATASFSVRNYTAFGYVVQLSGGTMRNGTHAIDPMLTTNTSQPGTEQFGVNLVANTSPTSFGANLNNGDFGHGQIMSNYSQANKFRYVEGETIAQAPKSSGATSYTLSYLVNVADLTPGGIYTTNQSVVVTGTY